MYDYIEVMKSDIKQHLEENFEYKYSNVESLEELGEMLNDNLWIEDSVTGNASGSYFCNSYTARECVLDNMDICKEALTEFCVDAETIGEKFLNDEWEYLDVTIRCYLLGQAIGETLQDIEEDFETWLEKKEAEEE